MTRMTPSPDVSPPRRLERWLRLVAGGDRWAEVAVGDLREEFMAMVPHGAAAARRWYWRQATLLAVSFVGGRLRRGVASRLRRSRDPMMRTLMREVRFAMRSTRRQPLVSIAVIVTLALGLGANAATFGMMDALLLRPFTFDGVDRMVVLSENTAADPYPLESVAPATFIDLRAQVRTLDSLTAFVQQSVNLAGGTQPEYVLGYRVSGDFFSLLGVVPAHGRLLDERDATSGGHRVVLSDGLWRGRFGGDPTVVGRTVTIDGLPYDVVGVAGPHFSFPSGTDLWMALGWSPEESARRSPTSISVVGRVRDGVSRDRVDAELAVLYTRLQAEHPVEMRGRRLVVRTFTEGLVDPGMPGVLTLWQAAAIFVLLIGVTNLANLLLARSAARERELAVRLALGAGRARLVRQLLVESFVLAVAALPAALAVAAATFALCRAAMPATLVRYVPGWDAMGVNATLLLFTLAASCVTAVLVGLLPALRASRPALTGVLRDGGRTMSRALARSRLRRGLVVAELALAVPLLVASGLSAVAAHRFANGPQGYDPDGVFRARTRLAPSTYPNEPARLQFAERLLEAARLQPGVTDAALASVVPASGSDQVRTLSIDGRPDPDQLPSVSYRAVTPDYMRVLRIPIHEGRGFTDLDRVGAAPVAMVTRSAVERHWPGDSVVGRRIRLGGGDQPYLTVVGVAGDVIDDWFARRGVPTVYVPLMQATGSTMNLVLRTSGDPSRLAGAARAAMAAADPRQPLAEAITMREALHVRTTGLRFIGGVMAAFGALALVLAAVGIYSVMAYYVAQRRQEMGIRIALGATAGDVLGLTMRHGGRMTAWGLVLGLAAAAMLSQLLERALFGVISLEPWLLAGVAGTLAVTAMLACLLPARQAAAVDAVVALRE